MSSNLPEGKVAILVSQEVKDFLIRNCTVNINAVREQLLGITTKMMADAELGNDEKMRELVGKLDILKNQFIAALAELEAE